MSILDELAKFGHPTYRHKAKEIRVNKYGYTTLETFIDAYVAQQGGEGTITYSGSEFSGDTDTTTPIYTIDMTSINTIRGDISIKGTVDGVLALVYNDFLLYKEVDGSISYEKITDYSTGDGVLEVVFNGTTVEFYATTLSTTWTYTGIIKYVLAVPAADTVDLSVTEFTGNSTEGTSIKTIDFSTDTILRGDITVKGAIGSELAMHYVDFLMYKDVGGEIITEVINQYKTGTGYIQIDITGTDIDFYAINEGENWGYVGIIKYITSN